MKAKRRLWLMVAMMLSVFFVSCSDEKEEPKEEPKEDPNQPVVGENFDIFQDLTCDEMVFVKGGTFTMGATEEQIPEAPDDDEYPAHEVTVGDFYIGKYEVTQELWEYVMGYNPSFPQLAKYPVENISLMDCVDFVANLNSLTGKHFDIPTEAEWEYAARGGNMSKGYIYSGSNIIDDVAWYTDNSSQINHQCGTKAPNELGIYDMSGNVSEWCSDWYDENYYASSPTVNPTGPKTGLGVVCRGGTYVYGKWSCRVSSRDFANADERWTNLGFRLVCRK